MSLTGIIFDIERFAIHDGPGIRTTLFLKGCPLSCWWCHNPESISPRRELVFFEAKCIGCGKCFGVCPVGAHERLPDGGRVFHRDTCTLCGKCVDACAAEALVMEGRQIGVEEAVEELSRDAPYYATSGGGVTLSGGEPMRQAAFSAAVLEGCRARGLHTALDTSGQAPWEDYQRVLPAADLVLYDLKLADPEEHRKYTGVTNSLILSNLGRIDEEGTPIEVRIPVVPGVNDGERNIEASADILCRLRHLTRVLLLPYHRMGEAKYSRLGRTYRLPETAPPTDDAIRRISARLAARGLKVESG
jgi:pyruvate formate lyase activating enzyme